jgi:4-alpha-glucanotransferase
MSRFDNGWRSSGLMHHITSLPSAYGIGDLGPEAHEFIPFLKKAGFTFWQILPTTPTDEGLGNSPYSSYSAFAGHELLISPDYMVNDGWLTYLEAEGARRPARNQIDFALTKKLKTALLDKAFNKILFRILENHDFQNFANLNSIWLNDYAFFMAAKADFGDSSWTKWPQEIKNREDWALTNHGQRLAKNILRVKFGQFIFFQQLSKLKQALNHSGLALIGDTAFYVNHDSSDVWANRQLFYLDQNDETRLAAGVPPDYYSKTGQFWGNPVFNWPNHKAQNFSWWKSRLYHNLGLFDWVRLDHFRAFKAYWEIPADESSAVNGCWRPGPAEDFFQETANGGQLNLIAEDLGLITPDVTDLRKKFQFPGMRVMLFAFGEPYGLSTHSPFRIEPDNVVYSSTHDSNTAKGWFRQEADEKTKNRLSDLLGYKVNEDNAAWALIRLAFLSPAAIAMTQITDLLNLDEQSRLNLPGTPAGNWGWKMNSLGELTDKLAGEISNLNFISGRDNQPHPNILTY